MHHHADMLTEVLEFAKKEKQNGNTGTVYIQEKELAPGGEFLLEDEDTGSKFKEEIRLVLETTENSIYFAETFEEMLFFKQTLEQLENLKAYYPFEWVNEEAMEQKTKKLQNT